MESGVIGWNGDLAVRLVELDSVRGTENVTIQSLNLAGRVVMALMLRQLLACYQNVQVIEICLNLYAFS